MKFFKILGIIIVSTLVIGGLAIGIMGFSLFKGAEALSDVANQEVTQKIKEVGNNIVLEVPLVEEVALRYSNISICKPEGENAFFKSVLLEGSEGYSCFNNNCDISVNDYTKLPKSFDMYVYDTNKNCKKVKFDTEDHLTTSGYSVIIEFTDELLNKLNIVKKDYKVKSENSNGYSSWQIMGTKKVKFSYNQKIEMDVLLIDGNNKASIELK